MVSFQKPGMITVRGLRGLTVALAIVVCCIGGDLAVTHCAESWYTATVTCNTQFCQGQVGQHLPQPSDPYGVYYACTTASCCGQSYPTCFSLGISCNGSGKLADPAIRQHLFELAKSQDIMVSSCKGEFRPLAIALTEEPSPKPAEIFDPLQRRRTLVGIGRGGR